MRFAGIAAAAACAIASLVWMAAGRPSPVMFGFTARGAVAEAALERRFLSLPRARHISEEHRIVAGEPHVAGSERDYALAMHVRDRFEEYGLEDVAVTTHEVLLPRPQEVLIEMVAPVAWRATMREDPLPEDPDTLVAPEAAGIPYHAFSASGDVVAPAVDAGAGDPSDYAALGRRGVDVRGRIVLVRNSVPYSYRGAKVLAAEQRGAAGILIYSDPEDEPRGDGRAYPDGPWGPETGIQRGAVAYDFIAPGDPLTPGWPSVAGARRLAAADARALPRIMSAPLSYRDARAILDAREPVVHMRVRLDDSVRPVWTVTGIIRGTASPDELIIVGNHRDAWVFGGVDPSGGTAAMLELARALGALAKSERPPGRSILFASWDAEEFALTSSTEWGEEHEALLTQNAVAYINVDSAASGSTFTATAVPALNRVIAEAAQAVRDPLSGIPIAAAVRDRRARDLGAVPSGEAQELVSNRLGGGSDYTVFLNHLGIPVADISFAGAYGVYHSLYDTHRWVSKFGDPGFRYHAALVQLWGVLSLRLANADAIPLDYEEYADRIAGFVRDVERQSMQGTAGARAFEELRAAAERFRRAAAAFGLERDGALRRGDASTLRPLNRKVLRVERALLDAGGIRGRPWYRHLVYAPRPTYAPEVLPGVAEAVEAGDMERVAAEARRLALALERAARAMQ